MANKKSRKGGPIGIPKSSIPIVRTPSDRTRKTSGNKPGTRNSEIETQIYRAHKARKDPRVGSKKPVDLLRHKNLASTKPAEPEIKYQTPKHELDAIEADEQLQILLDKQESKALSKAEQEYVDVKLARHLVLCGLLGIDPEEGLEPEDIEQESDPITSLNAFSIDDFTD
ncbi:MAG: ribosome assembly protein YihI (activator of Der GTPase) [Glaciecola sp.]|jgi:ribosome assembly protein YihI (activator of Der GTPase)